MLVNIADDELGQGLQRNGNELLEALHKQRRQDLIHGNHDIGQRAAAKASVVCENESDLLGQAADDSVHVLVGDLQLVATVALEQAVDEHESTEVRAHPAVFPEAFEAGNGGGGDHLHHEHNVLEPCRIVHEGVLNATPLTVLCNAGLVIVSVTLTADAVSCAPNGVKAFKFLIYRSNYFIKHHYLPP